MSASSSSPRPARGRPTSSVANQHARRRVRTLLIFGLLFLVTVIILLISLAL
ncbi:hypothetical protein GTV32_22930 [Gordonia sp. SID5947]|uniref:hypothetical protein n=1 Tax=Gordonia sp. SID5947 TaxID=2690315 RepID=UPI001369744E|nr:hypothetical protein [Gordonia sp. SID5947]MYR08991.1 hypothetical protein [Gordonia sp. SID5947]